MYTAVIRKKVAGDFQSSHSDLIFIILCYHLKEKKTYLFFAVYFTTRQSIIDVEFFFYE